MRVYRSNRHIYVQIIDDSKRTTLVAMSTGDKDFDAADVNGKCEQAKKVGNLVAQKAKQLGSIRLSLIVAGIYTTEG
jgi:large subunit ribosomal protein L18